MIEFDYTIKSPLGLHTRPAAKITSRADKYESRISVACKGQKLNGKSLMGMIALKARQGDVLHVRIEGPDEEEAKRGILEVYDEVLGSSVKTDDDLPL
ncbi:MAG: HPr family phosphocarrier protein [Lachnospiraceae bacterium]|nr:HPr family phosphocarrier protein [Lachnospiraceae bacterium]